MSPEERTEIAAAVLKTLHIDCPTLGDALRVVGKITAGLFSILPAETRDMDNWVKGVHDMVEELDKRKRGELN